MTNLTKLFAIACASLVVGCTSAPKKPVGQIGAVNARAAAPYALMFNLETDFDESLALKPGAKGVRKSLTSLADVDRYWIMNAATKEELVRYALQWKERVKSELDRCQ